MFVKVFTEIDRMPQLLAYYYKCHKVRRAQGHACGILVSCSQVKIASCSDSVFSLPAGGARGPAWGFGQLLVGKGSTSFGLCYIYLQLDFIYRLKTCVVLVFFPLKRDSCLKLYYALSQP